MPFIALPLLIISGALLVFYPPALAYLSMLLPLEAPGVGAAIFRFKGIICPLVYAGYFLAVFRVFSNLWRNRSASLFSRRIYGIALLTAGLSGWICLSMFANDASKLDMAYASLGGIPGVIFALAYHNNRPARYLFVLIVAIHLIIGCSIIVFPGSPFTALRQPVSADMALPDVWSLETTGYKDTAQFESAVQFAFYGAVGLIVGSYMLLYNRGRIGRALGSGLAFLGAMAMYFTLERGVWIGALLGMLTLIVPLRRRPVGRLVYGFLLFAFALAVMALFADTGNPILVALREHFLSATEDRYRIPVAIRATDILLLKPLLGVRGDILGLIDQVGGAPHQSFYFFAVMYGIPAGVFAAIMTWRAIAGNIIKLRVLSVPGFTQHDCYLARALGWVVLGMALTNGMAGGMLGWMCLGCACLPWVYRAPRRKMMKPAVVEVPAVTRMAS